MRVCKVGGGVLTGPEPVRGLVALASGGDCVLVVSAFGRTTNRLEGVVRSCLRGDRSMALEELTAIVQWHRDCADALGVEWGGVGAEEATVMRRRAIAAGTSDPGRFSDLIVSLGEHLSSRIVAAFLAVQGAQTRWIDATSVIVTDDRFTAARVDWPRTRRALSAALKGMAPGLIPVVPGFIGGTPEGTPTTLGREGSDYTAALLGAALDASEVVLLKSVDGVLTADPRVVPAARLIGEMSFHQATRLFVAGAKVVHPKTVEPVRRVGIPLRVACFVNPNGGTVIGPGRSWGPGAIRAIVGSRDGSPSIPGMPPFYLTILGEPPIPASLARKVEAAVGATELKVRRRDTRRGTWIMEAGREQGEDAMRHLHDLVDADGEET